jgi:hypothetical protein
MEGLTKIIVYENRMANVTNKPRFFKEKETLQATSL